MKATFEAEIGTRKLVIVDAAAEKETEEVRSEALALPDQARLLKVEDSATLQKGNEFFLACYAMEKKIEKTFEPICKAAHQAHRAATKAKSDALAPVTLAKNIVRSEIENYREAQEDIRLARERIAQEEERRKAETRRIEEAAALEAQGHVELAEQMLEAPIIVPQVSLPTVNEELVGATFASTWRYRIIDPKALLQAAVDGKVSFLVKTKEALEEGTTGATEIKIEIGALLKATTKDFSLPGVQAWETKDLKATGR